MMEDLNFDKLNGLIPAIIQDAEYGIVLMVGFMNREALRRTLEEKRVWFWSRSKSRLWQKGETSGNFLDVVSIEADCDGDTVLIQAHPRGPVCHTGARSCFASASQQESKSSLSRLAQIIQDRKEKMPENSYTAKLFGKGIQKIGQKVGEEAVELAIAAQYQDTRRCVEETADLLYHVLVLLAAKGIPLDQVEAELSKRMTR